MAEIIDYPIPTGCAIKDRLKRVEDMIIGLKLNPNSIILDVGGCEYKEFCKQNNFKYTSLNLQTPINTGQGGYKTASDTVLYDGKTLPFATGDFDLTIINFVLHHAAENTIPILKQLKTISTKYVIIGEDLSSIGYPVSWHKRNYDHQPGGVYRSDNEWRELFNLLGFTLLKQGIIRRNDDPTKNDIYRTLYLLKV